MDRFNGQGVEAEHIIEMVAEDSEEKGMFEDSVKLFDLAGNHEKVVELLNKLLAQVTSQKFLFFSSLHCIILLVNLFVLVQWSMLSHIKAFY